MRGIVQLLDLPPGFPRVLQHGDRGIIDADLLRHHRAAAEEAREETFDRSGVGEDSDAGGDERRGVSDIYVVCQRLVVGYHYPGGHLIVGLVITGRSDYLEPALTGFLPMKALPVLLV